MSQAKDDSTSNPKRVTLTVAEVHGFADRLLSRGVSKLGNDQSEQQGDLRLAARVIRFLLRSTQPVEAILAPAYVQGRVSDDGHRDG